MCERNEASDKDYSSILPTVMYDWAARAEHTARRSPLSARLHGYNFRWTRSIRANRKWGDGSSWLSLRLLSRNNAFRYFSCYQQTSPLLNARIGGRFCPWYCYRYILSRVYGTSDKCGLYIERLFHLQLWIKKPYWQLLISEEGRFQLLELASHYFFTGRRTIWHGT